MAGRHCTASSATKRKERQRDAFTLVVDTLHLTSLPTPADGLRAGLGVWEGFWR